MRNRSDTRTVVVSNDAFASGCALPRVCVHSGLPVAQMYARRARLRFGSVHRLVTFIAGPVFMLAAATRPGLDGWLPVTVSAERRLVRLRRIRLVALLGFVATLVFCGLPHPTDASTDAVLRPVFIALFLALSYLTIYVERQHLRIEIVADGIRLTGVHNLFAQELERLD